MEKLNEEDNTLIHISHHHPLHLTDVAGDTAPQYCHACRSVCTGSIYQCAPCRYILHPSCARLGRTIRHPAHPEHALSLQLAPRNEAGCHLCRACHHISYSFFFHCEACKFDLHLPCAALPDAVAAPAPAHPHPLKLTYEDPRRSMGSFDFCMVCRAGYSTARWFYACKECGLGGHVGCVVPDMPLRDQYAALDEKQMAVANAARWMETPLPESQQLEALLDEQATSFSRFVMDMGGMLPLFAKACQE